MGLALYRPAWGEKAPRADRTLSSRRSPSGSTEWCQPSSLTALGSATTRAEQELRQDVFTVFIVVSMQSAIAA